MILNGSIFSRPFESNGKKHVTFKSWRAARFKGVEKREFLDNRHLYGNGFTILDEAMRFLQRHLPIAGRLGPDAMIRKDEPLFPVSALREALVNAICHRDYVAPGGSISAAVYDDRVEIWSTGLLPAGISIDDLSKSHESKPRNPLIADVFYFRGLVERWGEGTRNIITACQQAGHPTPEFIEQSGAIGVRFLMAAILKRLKLIESFGQGYNVIYRPKNR